MDLMLDLETLSTRPDCVITQIGAALFDPNERGVAESVQIEIDPQTGIDAGRHVDWNTIAWWMGESEAARNALVNPERPRSHNDAIEFFVGWALETPGGIDGVWGFGASFDVAATEHAIKSAGLVVPWSHRASRCLRTLAAMPTICDVERPEPTIAHRGEDDAIAQALWVQNLTQHQNLLRQAATENGDAQ